MVLRDSTAMGAVLGHSDERDSDSILMQSRKLYPLTKGIKLTAIRGSMEVFASIILISISSFGNDSPAEVANLLITEDNVWTPYPLIVGIPDIQKRRLKKITRSVAS